MLRGKMFDENSAGGAGAAAPAVAVTPQSIASIIEVLIDAEPTVVEVIEALYPNNPLISAAVAIFPTLQPVLKQIEAVLAALK